MLNTRLNLMYRDASNYKSTGEVVFAGAPTPELVNRFYAACDDDAGTGPSIICEQVAIEKPSFGGVYEDDHPWVEVSLDPVGAAATDHRTFEEFVQEVEAAAVEGWDELHFDPVRQLVGAVAGHALLSPDLGPDVAIAETLGDLSIEVTLPDDERLVAKVTSEGIVFDLFRGDEHRGTEAATYVEIADRLEMA